MKHNSLKKTQYFLNSLLIFSLIFPAHILSATLDNTPPPSIALEQFLSDDDYETILNNPARDYAFIPPQVRSALRTLCNQCADTEITTAIDAFLDTTKTIAAYKDTQTIIESAAAFLETLNEASTEYAIITEYMRDIISGDALILMKPSDENVEPVRSCHTKTYCNLTVNNMLRTRWLSVCGNALINGDLIVNGSISGSFPPVDTNITFVTENGNATSAGNTINVLGTPNIITSGAGSTITIGIDGTTNNAVQVGNVAGGLTSLPLGTDGQVLIGATGGTPLFANITSVGGSIQILPGPNSLNLEATSLASTLTFITENGNATTLNGMITFTGNPNITTSGSGSTVTIGLDDSIVVPGTVTVNSGVMITGGGLSVIGTVTFGSLGAGMLSTNASSVVSANATTDHAVQIGNANGNLTSIPVGTNGQVLIAATGADPAFATLTSNNGSITFTTGANSLDLAATNTMAFGNTVRVDAVFGNDATGQRNGAPFLTITAALAAAQAGDMVWIFPGTYAESFTIPASVSVVGTSRTGVNITLTTGAATDLVTMGNGSNLSNVTLSLSSAALVQLRGIVFPGTTSATASVRNVTLTVNSTNAGAATSYGIHSNGTGTPNENTPNVELSTIVVTSAGSGTTRGILLNTSANNFNVRESTIRVSSTGGSAIGAETNIGGSQLSLKTSSISGTTADISQTLGTIILEATDLLNSNANTLGFTARQVQSNIIWADVGALPAGTNTMKVGTNTPNGNEQFIYCPQNCIAKSLSVRNLTTPGTTNTFTLRKNGINTTLAVSLANPATSAINNTTTVTFAAGDSISMQCSRGGAGATETVVMVELY